jgi:hypothetical protein
MDGIDLFWNLNQERRLRGLSFEADTTARGAGRTTDELARLQGDVERLTLACAAMWSLLKEQGHTDEQLAARMQELDLRDGKADGKLAPGVVTCTGCGRKSRPDRKTCMYCSAELPRGPAFG